MLSTRNDRVLRAEAAPGDVLALTITTGGGSIDIDWGDGTPIDTVASGVRQDHQYDNGYTGDVIVSPSDPTDMLQTYTDWVIEGNFVGDASQLPLETSSAIIRNGDKIEQKAEWVPPTMSTLTATNNSGLTTEESDKIIRAIEAGTQNNGILKLNGQVGLATAELETLTDAGGRNWGIEQRPDVVFESEPAEYPYSRKLSDNRWRLAQTNAPGTPRPEQRTRPMVFNRTDDRVNGPPIAELPTDQITYCTSFRVTDNIGVQVIMCTRTQSNRGVCLRANSGALNGFVGNGTSEVQVTGGTITAGKWHHAAITFDSFTVRLYLDGVEVATDVLEGFLPIEHSGTYLGIGSRDYGYNYFGGGIMDTRVYDRNLTPDELTQIAAMREGSDDVGPLDPKIWYLGGGHGYQSRLVNVARDGVNTAHFMAGDSLVDLDSQLIDPTADFDISLDFFVDQDNGDAVGAMLSQYTDGAMGRLTIYCQTSSDFLVGYVHNDTGDDVDIASYGTMLRDTWQTIRFTRTGNVFNLYVDGALVGTATETGVVVQSKNTYLGSDRANHSKFNGKIRNVSITSGGTTTTMLNETETLPEGATLDDVVIVRDAPNYDATVISSAMLTFNGYYSDDFISFQNQFGYNTGPALDTTGLVSWTSALGGKTALTGEFEIRYRALLHNAYESFIGVVDATGLARTSATYAAVSNDGYGGYTLGNAVRAQWKLQLSVNSPLTNDLNPEVIIRRDSDDLVTVTIDGVEYVSETDADTLYFYSAIKFAASHMSCPVITHMSIDGVAVDPYEEFEPTNGGKIIDAGFIPVKPGETTDIYGNTPRYLGEIPREPRAYTKTGTFDDANLDSVYAPNPLDRHVGSFTYEARFTSSGFKVYPMIFAGSVASVELRLFEGNVVQFVTHAGIDWTALTSPVQPYNTWVHAVGVYDADAAKARLYINGKLVGEEDVTGSESAGTHDPILYAGARLNSYYHNGQIQDQRVYTRALTDEEVASNYAGNAPATGGLVMDWAYSDGAGNRIHNVAPQEGWVSSGTGTDEGTSYLDTGVTLDGATEFTIFRRMRYLSKSSYDLDGFFGSSANERVRIGRKNSNNNFWLDGAASSETIASVDLDDGVIQSTAITCKVGELARVYVDGEFKSSSIGSMGSAVVNNSPARNYYIGAANESGGILNHSNAEYYEYWIYSRKLTDDEILYLHTQGATGTDPGDTNLEYRKIWHGWPGKLSSTNETDFWSNTQDVNERQLRVGHHAATKYSGVGQHFESESDRAVGNGLGLTYTFTNSFWLKSIGDNDGILEFHPGWPNSGNSILRMASLSASGGVIAFRLNDETLAVTFPYPQDGLWHHVAITYDSLELLFYVDGEVVGQQDYFNTVDFRDCEMILGAYYSTAYPLAGHLSDVIIQTHPATPAEVLDLMAGKNIRSDAFRFPFGNGIETNRGVQPMSKIGSPQTYGVQARQFPFVPHDYDHAATLYDGNGDGYSINGGVGRITVGESVGKLSCGLWVQLADVTGSSGLIGEYEATKGWMLYYQGNQFTLTFRNGVETNSIVTYNATGTIEDGQWVHLVGTFDEGQVRIYVNGELVHSETASVTYIAFVHGFRIGNMWVNHRGALSQIAVEQAVWTPDQTAKFYSGEEVPPNAFHFPRGDGELETQRGLDPMALHGNPAPNSAKTLPLPVRGPGVLSPSHQLVLASEPNSVVGRKLAGRTFKAGDYTGNVGDNRQFGNPDDTVTVYEDAMSAALANEVSTSHIKGNL